MPTVSEKDLGSEAQDCIECDEFEGAIWLCGEGYLCERCFAKLAGVGEEELFDDEATPLLDYEISPEAKAKAKFNLRRPEDGQD